MDESGASIGRRYARADELGIPYAVTIDFDTLGVGASESSDPALVGTATLRDRDSTDQVRLPLASIPDFLNKLCTAHPLTFADLMAAYGTGNAAKAADGASSIVDYLAASGTRALIERDDPRWASTSPDCPRKDPDHSRFGRPHLATSRRRHRKAQRGRQCPRQGAAHRPDGIPPRRVE